MSEIILTPFNMNAVYAFHILEKQSNILVSGFFDNKKVY